MNRTFLCAAIFVVCVFVQSYAHTAKQVYRNLDEKEKKYFLQYFLAKGYVDLRKSDTSTPELEFPHDLNIPNENIQDFEKLDIDPDNFASTFFRNFTKKYNVSDMVALGWARGEIWCFPNGECIDLGDVGSICCT